VQPPGQLALRLRAGEFPDELPLGEGEAAVRDPGGEVLLQAGEGPVPEQPPELECRFALDDGVHEWNIPGLPMV